MTQRKNSIFYLLKEPELKNRQTEHRILLESIPVSTFFVFVLAGHAQFNNRFRASTNLQSSTIRYTYLVCSIKMFVRTKQMQTIRNQKILLKFLRCLSFLLCRHNNQQLLAMLVLRAYECVYLAGKNRLCLHFFLCI